jgi:Uma2 family endonuclease
MVMTQAKPRFSSFESYLSYSNAIDLEGRYELIQGELVPLPPEAEPNQSIANYLYLLLVAAGIPPRLIHIRGCEVQVPILELSDPANRFPDVVILRPEHLPLTQRRLTITRDMPPPRLIVEVVSHGKTNQERDYIKKRAQYAAIAVAEYWLISPAAGTVLVWQLQGDDYREVGLFSGDDAIASPEFPKLALTAAQVLSAGDF